MGASAEQGASRLMARMWTLKCGVHGQLSQSSTAYPACGNDHAIVRVVAAGLQGGAWRELADGEALPNRALGEYPSPLLVGIVQDPSGEQSSLVGQAVAIMPAVACGTCAACVRGEALACQSPTRAGFRPPCVLAETLVVPASNLVTLVPGRRLEEATLVGTAAGVLRAVRQARVCIGESVAVFGTGLQMVLASQWVRVAGAYDVYIVGDDPAGLALARKLWLGERIDGSRGQGSEQILALRAGQGVDLAIVKAGDTQGLKMARKTIAADGRILVLETPVVAFPGAEDSDDAPPGKADPSEIRCPCVSWSRNDWEIAARTWGSGRLALRDLIAEILPLSELVRRINQKDLGDGTHVVGILG